MQNSLSDFLQNLDESNRFQSRSANSFVHIKVAGDKTGRKSGDVKSERKRDEESERF